MRTPLRLIVSSCVVTACFMGCPPPPTECIDGTEPSCPDAGGLPPDFCNSQAEAVADSANCHLAITTGGEGNRQPKSGLYISRLEDAGIDQDWYFAQAPGNLTPRSLLHISGGYSGVPQSAVNFSINVLKEGAGGALVSVATAIDKHGAAAPKPIDVILPFGESNARLFALVADEGAGGMARVDNRSTYSLYMEVIENPDSNEPNDTTPTPIALAGTPAMGTQTGYLATNDDVDQFSFQVTGGGRQIIYLHITELGTHPMPPPPYRLSYTLFDPADRPIAEGAMPNEFLTIDLATARLAPMTGTYRVQVKGFRAANNTLPIRGDLRVGYQVAVQLLPDLDTQEGANGNDTAANARPITVPANGRLNVNGKLSYVPDEEWFLVSLAPRASPSTLRYRLRVSGTPGRFPPLTATPARQLRVTRQVTMGATAQDRQVNCRTNATACFRGSDVDPMLVDALCNASDPPQCLFAQRNEEARLMPNLRNLVGAVPVFANQQSDFLIMIRDEGVGADKYADDKDWTLELDWVDDADEASRLAGPTVINVGGTTSVATGELTFGYGRTRDFMEWFRQDDRLRGNADYDAYDTDRDLFQFNVGAAASDQAWEISWELMHPDGGTRPPGDIALEFTFCGTGAASDAGLCANADRQIFGYNPESLTPWYLPQSFSNGTMLFSRTSTATSTTITALPVACSCLSAPRATTGVFFANIAAIDRVENDPIRYRISQRLAPYPANFTGPDGGSATCPVVDGGCGFARPRPDDP